MRASSAPLALCSLFCVTVGCSAEIASVPRGDGGLASADAGSERDASDGSTPFDGGHPVDAAPDASSCDVPFDAMVAATITVTADDHFKLYVNGVTVDETPRTWSAVQTYAVTLFRHPGRKNVVAIAGINAAKIDGFDRGIIADIALNDTARDGGTTAHVTTDSSWKFASSEAIGWSTLAFDDSAWGAAVAQGANGIAPWGAILGNSSAQWIWSYASSGSAASKATTENVYVRKTFYLTRDFVVTGAPSACP